MAKKKSRKKTKAKSRKIMLIILAVAVLVSGTCAAIAYPFIANESERSGMVYIYPDMKGEAVADTLKAKFGDDFGSQVERLMAFRKALPGAYMISEGESPYDCWKRLSRGAQTPVKFTFNNVRTIENFAERAGNVMAFSKEDMLDYLTKQETLDTLGVTLETLPSILLPDTYEAFWTNTPEKLIRRIKKNCDAFWTEDRKLQAEALGLTPVEVVTLASIVEEETAYGPEKGTVARLYMNRLDKGMKLQSDPTVKFALGDETLRRILNKHLSVESPYNTYLVYGLPPGPIRMPSKATIDAVLKAPKNDFLYMCAKEDFSGSHNFTSSYAQHMANARKYQVALNKRGIK